MSIMVYGCRSGSDGAHNDGLMTVTGCGMLRQEVSMYGKHDPTHKAGSSAQHVFDG